MKKYKLKQWYPSLGSTWITGDIAVKSTWDYYYHTEYPNGYLPTETEVENNPDFWELIEEEKPLFVTEDGVEIYINNVELFAVNSTFITASDNNFDVEVCKKEGWKLFFHKSNADEYILWNKPLLSLQEIDATIKGHLPEFDELKKLAKEGIDNGK